MKNIRSKSGPFDVIAGGLPVCEVTSEWQIFDEELANFIGRTYTHLVDVEDATPTEVLEADGVVDVETPVKTRKSKK